MFPKEALRVAPLLGLSWPLPAPVLYGSSAGWFRAEPREALCCGHSRAEPGLRVLVGLGSGTLACVRLSSEAVVRQVSSEVTDIC